MFADLECDVVNPIELCESLNPVMKFNSVRAAAIFGPGFFDGLFPAEFSADPVPVERPSGGISLSSVFAEEASARCDRNIQEHEHTKTRSLC